MMRYYNNSSTLPCGHSSSDVIEPVPRVYVHLCDQDSNAIVGYQKRTHNPPAEIARDEVEELLSKYPIQVKGLKDMWQRTFPEARNHTSKK